MAEAAFLEGEPLRLDVGLHCRGRGAPLFMVSMMWRCWKFVSLDSFIITAK